MIIFDLFYSSGADYNRIVRSNISRMNAINNSQVIIPRNIIRTGTERYMSGLRFDTFKWQNPYHSYFFFNDKQAEAFVRQHMPPHIIHAYEIMPVPILKADYFRYISTYILGGVYSDLDTECLRPIDTWTDNYTNVSFIVGVEAEGPLWKINFARPLQLCQWTFASAPKYPILKRIIDNIAKQTNIFIGRPLSLLTVLDWTGPGVWTDTIFDYINETYHVEWPTLTNLQYGRLIGDIYLLPISAFHPTANGNGAKGRKDPEARVWHYFHGGWKHSLPKTATRSSIILNRTDSTASTKSLTIH
jgi:alpha 1,6-mannosyltransferase